MLSPALRNLPSRGAQLENHSGKAFAVLSGPQRRFRECESDLREAGKVTDGPCVLRAPSSWPLSPFPLCVLGECDMVINCLFSNQPFCASCLKL